MSWHENGESRALLSAASILPMLETAPHEKAFCCLQRPQESGCAVGCAEARCSCLLTLSLALHPAIKLSREQILKGGPPAYTQGLQEEGCSGSCEGRQGRVEA